MLATVIPAMKPPSRTPSGSTYADFPKTGSFNFQSSSVGQEIGFGQSGNDPEEIFSKLNPGMEEMFVSLMLVTKAVTQSSSFTFSILKVLYLFRSVVPGL